LKAIIVYATLTGNTEQIVELLAMNLRALQVDVTVEKSDIDAYTTFQAKDFTNYDICVVGAYTYGNEGQFPDELGDIYDDLEKTDLSGKIYTCIGSGEEVYGYFCQAVEDFDKQFQKTNAKRGADLVKIEADPKTDEDRKTIQRCAEQLVEAVKNQS